MKKWLLEVAPFAGCWFLRPLGACCDFFFCDLQIQERYALFPCFIDIRKIGMRQLPQPLAPMLGFAELGLRLDSSGQVSHEIGMVPGDIFFLVGGKHAQDILYIDTCQYVFVPHDDIALFKALSDGTRLGIIRFLLNGEKCVCEIFPHVKRTQSTVSIQLGKLEELGMVESERRGKWVYYRIKDGRIRTMLNAIKHGG